MKKIFKMFAIAALTVSFVACGGGKKTEPTVVEEEVIETEVVTAPAGNDDVLAKYESLMDKAMELQKKVTSGDAAATQEYTKIMQEISDMSTELQEAVTNMTPEQAQRWAEKAQKWAASAQ